MENEKHLNISVVVPLYNEEESLPELYSCASTPSNSAETTENPRPFIVVSAWRRAMLSSLWMQTCKILQTRFRNFTG